MPDPTPEPLPTAPQGPDPAAPDAVLSGQVSTAPVIPGWETGALLHEEGAVTLWKATRLSDGAAAVIKVPCPADPALIRSLEAEAAALRALDHPNVARLLESGPMADGRLYLAMACGDSYPLSRDIPSFGLSVGRACYYFLQVAAAVAHAHSRGILHCNLHPAGILVDDAGNISVAGFGHVCSGTGPAAYIPPEALRPGFHSAPSADIYALGVLLYELLTGAPPCDPWLDASLQRTDVDIRVDDLIQRAIHPEPARRFPSVEAMTHALDRILFTPERLLGTPRITRAVRRIDFIWTLLGLFILTGTLGLIARVKQYDIPLPVDLIGSESLRIGTLRACFILAAAAVPLALWQWIRLRRFRSVPLLDALPAPFGINAGTSSTAAIAVALAQLLFLAAPAAMAAYAWRDQCSRWLTEADPPSVRGLVVSEGSHGTVGHDPWDWPEAGREYFLRERSGWITDPLSTQIHHIAFKPGLMPRLLAGMAGFTAFVLVITILAAFCRWWRYRKWQPFFGLTILLLFSTNSMRSSIARRQHPELTQNACQAINAWPRGILDHVAPTLPPAWPLPAAEAGCTGPALLLAPEQNPAAA